VTLADVAQAASRGQYGRPRRRQEDTFPHHRAPIFTNPGPLPHRARTAAIIAVWLSVKVSVLPEMQNAKTNHKITENAEKIPRAEK
jgi:hypothetical protein